MFCNLNPLLFTSFGNRPATMKSKTRVTIQPMFPGTYIRINVPDFSKVFLIYECLRKGTYCRNYIQYNRVPQYLHTEHNVNTISLV